MIGLPEPDAVAEHRAAVLLELRHEPLRGLTLVGGGFGREVDLVPRATVRRCRNAHSDELVVTRTHKTAAGGASHTARSPRPLGQARFPWARPALLRLYEFSSAELS